jgi:CRP-like cAMP-binding protein
MEKTCERNVAAGSRARITAIPPEDREPKVIHMADPPHDGGLGPDILHRLTPQERTTLAAAGAERRYAAGERLFEQGDAHDGIVFILEGRVRSFYVSPRGRAITLAYWPGGHFVGAPQILGGGEHMWTSVAIEPTVGLAIGGAATEQLVRAIPNLAVALIEGLVYKSKCYTALLQLMGTESKTVRLAHLLLTLAEPGDGRAGRHVVSQDLTQEELATMIGATRQAVSVALDRFEKGAMIERRGCRIAITDMAQLRRLCE